MIDNQKWPLKPEILISLELWQIVSKFQRQIQYFDLCVLDRPKDVAKWLRRQPEMARCIYCCFRLSIVVAIALGQFSRAQRGRKPQICLCNFGRICQGSRNINICHNLSEFPACRKKNAELAVFCYIYIQFQVLRVTFLILPFIKQ